MKKSELKKIIQEEIHKIFEESFKPTDTTTMIFIGGHPYYLKKSGDSTHFSIFWDKKYLKDPALDQGYHIGQFNGKDYYEDVRKWLKGSLNSKQLFGRKYKKDEDL